MLADVLTKEEVRNLFPKPDVQLGPIFRGGATMYGRDFAFPLSTSVIAAAVNLMKVMHEVILRTTVTKMWWHLPISATAIHLSEGETFSLPPLPLHRILLLCTLRRKLAHAIYKNVGECCVQRTECIGALYKMDVATILLKSSAN